MLLVSTFILLEFYALLLNNANFLNVRVIIKVMDKAKNKKNHGLKKFLILISILIGYAIFVIIKFGVKDGLAATALTWAFFVTCTPIADAGFIVDFPVRLFTGLKMIWSEVIVWVLAISIIAYNYIFNIEVFGRMELLEVFKKIIETPWPLWTIVIVSFFGTFLSIYIGDQIYNLVQQHNHHKHIKKLQLQRLFIEVTMFVIILVMYFSLLNLTGVTI